MVEMELVGVRVELPTNTPIVLLRETGGDRRMLPIFIGAPEATAIAFALGLGGSAFLVGLSQYRLYFVLIGLVLVAAAGWRILRPGGCCAALPLRARLSRFALVLAVFGGGYAAINYLLLPWLYTVG